jgi:Cof subfamily protein (haloacid dehalogenase superfamily)
MLQVIALDIDGTLIRNDWSVSTRTLDSLKAWHDRGSRLVIATARPPRYISGFIPDLFDDAPCICYSGAEVYDDGTRIAQTYIKPESALEVVRAIEAQSVGATISAEIGNRLFTNRPLQAPWPHQVVDLYTTIRDPLPKILFRPPDIRDLDALLQSLPSDCKCVMHNNGSFGEIIAASVSKANGLTVLLERWGLTFRDVISFGDDISDLEMIAGSGIGVAMGNAAPEVKAVADRVTGSNDDDGIAEVLEELRG